MILALAASLVAPVAVGADENALLAIEPGYVDSVLLPEAQSSETLLIQATSWVSDAYYYVITISNLSPWPIGDLYLLDRYFPNDPNVELSQEWLPEYLDPGQADVVVIRYDEGPLELGCHQLELAWSGGWSAVLMDCSDPGSTTLWEIAVQEEMAYYVEDEALSAAEPVGGSKLGIHVTRNSSPDIMSFVIDAQPAVVVAVGDVGWLADVKEESPGTVTIGRFKEPDQSFEGDPSVRARDFVNSHAGLYLANEGVDYWLGWNEPVIDAPWQMEWYAEYERERVIAMAELGLKCAIGNFSTGTPEADEFAKFLPAIAAAKAYDGILALHEYSAPTMRNGVSDGIPGIEPLAESGSLTLRYRYWYETYLRHNDLVIPLVLTEAGIDGGVLRDTEQVYGGWRDFGTTEEGLVTVTLDEYLEQLSWYDDELRRDDYVWGFAIFNLGDPEGEWATWDMTDQTENLTEIVGSKIQ